MSRVRRVAEGLRTRRATELLVELVLLVAGILLALGVDGWLERQREAAVAAQSLELVRNDLVQLGEQAEELEAHHRQVLEAIGLVWSAVSGPGPVARDTATFEALSLMAWRRTVRFPRAAYEELVATGNLRALPDPDLRAALVRFYEELDRTEEIILRNNEVFTDGLFVGLALGEGLIVNLPTDRTDFAMTTQSPAEAIRLEYLPFGPTFRGRLWDLPTGHPDRERLLSATVGLSSAASGHVVHARRVREGATALIARIDEAPGGKE